MLHPSVLALGSADQRSTDQRCTEPVDTCIQMTQFRTSVQSRHSARSVQVRPTIWTPLRNNTRGREASMSFPWFRGHLRSGVHVHDGETTTAEIQPRVQG